MFRILSAVLIWLALLSQGVTVGRASTGAHENCVRDAGVVRTLDDRGSSLPSPDGCAHCWLCAMSDAASPATATDVTILPLRFVRHAPPSAFVLGPPAIGPPRAHSARAPPLS